MPNELLLRDWTALRRVSHCGRSSLVWVWIYRWGRSAGYARVRGLALVLYREDDTMSAIGQVDKDGIEWASGSDVRSRARRLIPYER